MPETVEDNLIGTALSTVVLALIFRYGFDDSWAVALVIALVWAPIAFGIVELIRRRSRRAAAS